MRGRTITGLIAALAVGTLVLLAAAPPGAPADDRAPWWPKLMEVGRDGPPVSEWYTDLPWHQKLGTYAGNEITEALVFPYGALEDAAKADCTTRKPPLSQAACMLEYGVVNVLGTLRTDTRYDPSDTRITAATECTKDQFLPCIEVKLELSHFWTRFTRSGPALQRRVFGQDVAPPFLGASFTDGSTYGPQMPWEMAHYCDSWLPGGQFPLKDNQDAVCYADYFSPFNNGFSILPEKPANAWPRSQAWSVFPQDDPGRNHCKAGLTTCTLVLGGFDLSEVLPTTKNNDPNNLDNPDFQYKKYNEFLLTWFNQALKGFPTDTSDHFPWRETLQITWTDTIYPRAVLNPFLGQFKSEAKQDPNGNPVGCDTTVTGPTLSNCSNAPMFRATQYLYPRQCNLADLAGAARGTKDSVKRLRECGLDYELHPNGWGGQWPQGYQQAINTADMVNPNQYGRTSFLFAGIPGLQLPVSFYKDDSDGLSVYERVYNASIFSLYLPVANVADTTHAFTGRNYKDIEFYHTLLMSNHMEAEPELFASGIRGKALWHNEYRTKQMYTFRDQPVSPQGTFAPDQTFAAAFDPKTAKAPFHNNTCDGCHVRNGSGVPINTEKKLDKTILDQGFMKNAEYYPFAEGDLLNPKKDYTFTGQIRPMKLVFVDLKRDTRGLDASRYSEPLSFPLALLHPSSRTLLHSSSRSAGVGAQAEIRYYNNAIMNFYGDAFHVTQPGYSYVWNYGPVNQNRLVVNATRVNSELKKTYAPQQVNLGAFTTPSPPCDLVTPAPTTKPWPKTCDDINGTAIDKAITQHDVGYLLLNGKRLGNLSALEAIPNQEILGFRAVQKAALGAHGDTIAGEIIYNAGTRDGVGGPDSKIRNCATKSLADCYIGRFGWLGDRVSLEDQVANAAFVEMNMTTSEGSKKLYPRNPGTFPVRYDYPNCGPANKKCLAATTGNGDLSELDIQRMADYGRWIGNPTRSEFMVSLPEVIAGEKIFRKINCHLCHVIAKIEIVPEDTMLPKAYRDRLTKRVVNESKIHPFLSYIGTDLLMHDMGYLSQVADASQPVRNDDGTVKTGFENYVQKVRTPALKGLRFNRFVTDSHKNANPGAPACDFLLHDGRACDAIEAAFLHDGPAIKQLQVIEGLNGLSKDEIRALRAFLYSL